MGNFLKTILTDGRGGAFHSFNKDYHLVNKTTKVVIVGTITSPQGRGVKKDFYYMSPYNPMYRIIDAYFNSTNRVSSFVINKKKGDIKAIIEELNEKGIAFIDVIKSCSNPKNSSLDNDLEDIELDYRAFTGINEDVPLIANSKNAYQALLRIKEKNSLNNGIKYVYGFRFYKQDDWNKAFKEINL